MRKTLAGGAPHVREVHATEEVGCATVEVALFCALRVSRQECASVVQGLGLSPLQKW